MSEKRFDLSNDNNIRQNGIIIGNDEVVGLLNEQQATISALKEENKELGKNFDDIVEWASEIAKRNVVLDEQIGQLQRENEQLRKELGDCEKFRYTVFKRLNDEYIKECSIR